VVSMRRVPSSPVLKPVSEVWRLGLTRLPVLTWRRRLFRVFIRRLCRVLIRLCTRSIVRGVENYPRQDPALVVINHLGDADAVLVLACLPEFPELIGKIELRSIRILRLVTDGLGIIWVHRGQPDRRAIAAALEAFLEGRRVLIAPEARESITGVLEQGTDGAAFLALHAKVPVVPITVTGTENWRVYGNLKRLRRTKVTLTVGQPIILRQYANRHETMREGTRYIMEALARQLPPEYRGVYSYVGE
jgi:1-acyl-sn-glycerol-3-phosphate acyltransferase